MAKLVFSVLGLWCITLAAAGGQCGWDFEDVQWDLEFAIEDLEWAKEDILQYCGSMDRPDENIFTGSAGLPDNLKKFSCSPGELTCPQALSRHAKNIRSWSSRAAKDSHREFRRRDDCMDSWKTHDELQGSMGDKRQAVYGFCTSCSTRTCPENRGTAGCSNADCDSECADWCHQENQAHVCLKLSVSDNTSMFLNLPTIQAENTFFNFGESVQSKFTENARFRGDLRVTDAGSYKFTEDGGRLSIDGSPATGTVNLDSGIHAVEIVFDKDAVSSQQGVSLRYEGPDTDGHSTLIPFNKWEKPFDGCGPQRVACEQKGHRTHPDCILNSRASCKGTVTYGHGNGWATKQMDGDFDCSNTEFGDPIPGQAKECDCEPA